MSEANKEEALKALRIGAEALRAGQRDKAARFLEKSLSMFETAEARALLAQARAAPAAGPGPGPGASPAGARAGGGARRRPAAAAARAPEPPPRDTRPYTAEQAAAVKRVKQCKDLYQVLGLDRAAGAEEVKKAYKKMAMKLHPDKNSAPGADEAFKELARAFSVLSDPQKKAAYDQFGDESDGPQRQFTRRHYQEDFDPADIFAQVFGAGFMPQGGRVYTFGPGGFRPAGGAQQARGAQTDRQAQVSGLLQLLPLLLLLFMSMVNFPQSSQPALFSLQKNGVHTEERKTFIQGVVPDIPYFVEASFRRDVARDYRKLQKIESEVQMLYFRYLDAACKQDTVNVRRQAQLERNRGNRDAADRMLAAQPKSCEEYERINSYLRS
jgi:hypothetical protein